MTDQNTSNPQAGAAGNPAEGQDAKKPVFSLQRVYLKDLSLELPNAPRIFLETEQPKVEVQLNIGVQRLSETLYETSVTATVTTKVKDQVLYLAEGKQAGIFEIANVPMEQLDPLLGIVCPNMLYPYLRANIADAITRTSLPPLHLSEVNFQAMYEQRLAEHRAKQQQGEAAAAGSNGQGGQGGQNGQGDQQDSGLIVPPGAR